MGRRQVDQGLTHGSHEGNSYYEKQNLLVSRRNKTAKMRLRKNERRNT